MNIRQASSKDHKGISELLFQLMTIDSAKEAKKIFLDELNNGIRYIIAEEDGKVIGLAAWLMHGRPKHGLAELTHIVVSKYTRGKGVGRKLFHNLIEELKKHFEKNDSRLRKLFLLTRAANSRAYLFYEKLGLKLESTLRGHFYNEHDEYFYSMFFE